MLFMFLTKKTLKSLFFACLLLVLSSCKKNDDASDSTSESTLIEENSPTESIINTPVSPDFDNLEERAYNSGFVEIQSGDSYDFNLDGKKEPIEFRFIKNDMNYLEDCEVKIGGVTSVTEITRPTGKVYISALTTSQTSLQVLIDEYGPSDDPMTTILYYKDNEINEVGKVGGLVASLKSLGYGLFQSYERANTLQTWYHPKKFYITESSYNDNNENLPTIIYMPNELYAVGTSVKLLLDVPLLNSQTNRAISSTLSKDSVATIVASDDNNWIYIKGNDVYYAGWVEINGLHVIINGKEYDGQDVFDGLWLYD